MTLAAKREKEPPARGAGSECASRLWFGISDAGCRVSSYAGGCCQAKSRLWPQASQLYSSASFENDALTTSPLL